jgi:DNA/RNA endonuclease YhcR with UshA esterase domain
MVMQLTFSQLNQTNLLYNNSTTDIYFVKYSSYNHGLQVLHLYLV